jgi:hypothetical protein
VDRQYEITLIHWPRNPYEYPGPFLHDVFFVRDAISEAFYNSCQIRHEAPAYEMNSGQVDGAPNSLLDRSAHLQEGTLRIADHDRINNMIGWSGVFDCNDGLARLLGRHQGSRH